MMKPMFSENQLDRWFEIFEEKAENKIVEKLKEAGEIFVKLARDNGSYDNQTENLRSSIGYVIVYNGKSLTDNFRVIGKGKEGSNVARQLAADVSSKTLGYVLIGVAGMQYAAAVESKGFEVISNSSFQTEMWLRKSIQTIFEHASRNGANFKG